MTALECEVAMSTNSTDQKTSTRLMTIKGKQVALLFECLSATCILAEVDIVLVPRTLVVVAGAFVGEVPFGNGREIVRIGVACCRDGNAIMFANVGIPVGAHEECEHRCRIDSDLR